MIVLHAHILSSFVDVIQTLASSNTVRGKPLLTLTDFFALYIRNDDETFNTVITVQKVYYQCDLYFEQHVAPRKPVILFAELDAYLN